MRVPLEKEIVGADLSEHGIQPKTDNGGRHSRSSVYESRKTSNVKRMTSVKWKKIIGKSSDNSYEEEAQVDESHVYVNDSLEFLPEEEIKENHKKKDDFPGSSRAVYYIVAKI